jgi:hypothetical protein
MGTRMVENTTRYPGDVDSISVEGEEPVRVERGSDNVFADLGFENPEEELARADLAIAISRILREPKLTQREAASVMGVTHPARAYRRHVERSPAAHDRGARVRR